MEHIRTCNDLAYLESELKIYQKTKPECTAHMFYLQNMVGLLKHRIDELKKGVSK